MRLSWSGLRVQEECSEKGYHKRQGNFSKRNNQRVFFPVTVLDRVVRDWLDAGGETDAMPDMVEAVMDREWKIIRDEGGEISWRDSADRARVLSDVREAVDKIQPALQRLVLPFDYQSDYRFSVPVNLPHPAGGTEEILLIGAMDILVRDASGRFCVWDVKMTRDNDYWRKTRGQLTFYDVAVLLSENSKTYKTGLLQPLCREEIKVFEISDNDRAQMMQRISAFARAVWNKERTPRQDTTYCRYCEARNACSKFEASRDEKGRRTVALF